METRTPMATLAEPDLLAAADEILAASSAEGADTRVLGGIAVAMRCPTARGPGVLARAYSDVDLVTTPRAVERLEATLERLGYEPQVRFNALHGRVRRLFDRRDGIHADVFVGDFAMCHRLDLGARLGVHDTTVSLADLVLTKLQVAALNEKDVTDATALFVDHELTPDESGINEAYVVSLLARDWGWWRTVTANLDALRGRLDERLTAAELDRARQRIAALSAAVAAEPKSLRWKVRAKAGDRIPWREDPEETA